MASPREPIFIIEGHDVGIFASVEAAQNQLEPTDVSDAVYKGYDAEGRRLKITTDGQNTVIAIADSEPLAALELERELRRFLIDAGDLRVKEQSRLTELVEIAKAFDGSRPRVGKRTGTADPDPAGIRSAQLFLGGRGWHP
ncbi:MAG: hypothetical protein GEU71_08820 [Actinobacteria bacterium]|jgi:hypothetical protein|nr:hypothetical protein [Actinomycetota bacterium]